MSRNHSKQLTAAAIAAGALLAATQAARAVPVNGMYIEDARCDALPTQFLTHELGDVGFFPINEAITVNLISTPNQTVCVPDDGLANDWLVQMTNVSGISWFNLFFVGDQLTKVGNADGSAVDLTLAPNLLTDAFKIDGTVTNALNDNLISEVGGTVNEIFEPGETWTFNVSNFSDSTGGLAIPVFITPGQFAGSSPPTPAGSNASILAVPVPEPTTIGSIGVLAAAMLMRRRPRRG